MADALYEKVLKHQLEGIMFHFDLMRMYKLFGKHGCCCIHYRQLDSEQKNHAKTVLKLIEETGTIIQPTITPTTSKYSKLIEKPADKEMLTMHFDALTDWLAWEKDTVSLYSELATAHQDCRLWERLKKNAEAEVKLVEKIIANVV